MTSAGPVADDTPQQEPRRLFLFLGLCAASVIVCYRAALTLASLAIHDDRYSVTLVIPFLSLAMVWSERKRIFASIEYAPKLGLIWMLAGLGIFATSESPIATLQGSLGLSTRILALLVLWTGAFLWCYGPRPAVAAKFPLLFLLFMVPIPADSVRYIVSALQKSSAETSYRLLKLVGVPVLRQNFVTFSLPGVTIEVAEECSGIRSSSSLFISSLVAGYILLRSGWSRAAFSVMTIPVVIFKNAVRIVTISLLGVYVDPAFLTGRLHRYSGLPFSVLALALLAPLLIGLMKAERISSYRAKRPGAQDEPDRLPPVSTYKFS